MQHLLLHNLGAHHAKLDNELTDIRDWGRKVVDPDFAFERKSATTISGRDVTRSMAD